MQFGEARDVLVQRRLTGEPVPRADRDLAERMLPRIGEEDIGTGEIDCDHGGRMPAARPFGNDLRSGLRILRG
jgi:hypothetical protein